MQTGKSFPSWELAFRASAAVLAALAACAILLALGKGLLHGQNPTQQAMFSLGSFLGFAAFSALATGLALFYCIDRHVNRPIRHLLGHVRQMSKAGCFIQEADRDPSPLGELAGAINRVVEKTLAEQKEANRQRDEYQYLFGQVPCLITVQDRNFRLIRYNREFDEKFHPEPGDYCFHAYKGRSVKCPNCPVEKAFEDGNTHITEETAVKRDGTTTHWIAKAAPVRDASGRVVAAMEMNLDITQQKLLEQLLICSERNYREIFNNIPNPVFVLNRSSLEVVDCNQSVTSLYGYGKDQVLGKPFHELFPANPELVNRSLKQHTIWEKVRQAAKDGGELFVDLSVVPSEYGGKEALLVTVCDITKKLEAERQLIQAGKMATLGEMATGVAHELNQPLSVIKTGSSFLVRKVRQGQEVAPDILDRLLGKMDSNVDRATKIINHMRQFGRMSDLQIARVDVNEVWSKASEMFSQQLRVRGIELAWDLQENLPEVEVDPDRLEQVFINLILNARDAIESCWEDGGPIRGRNRITIRTGTRNRDVVIEVRDTGSGIPAKLLDKVFEPFFTTKEVGMGSGLGLSISYGIIKDCKGEIQVGSQLGKGTVFTITIPQKEPS